MKMKRIRWTGSGRDEKRTKTLIRKTRDNLEKLGVRGREYENMRI
jgi:hypothetical protein